MHIQPIRDIFDRKWHIFSIQEHLVINLVVSDNLFIFRANGIIELLGLDIGNGLVLASD